MVLLLDCERQLIRYINLPFGTRVVCWARKPAVVAERVTAPAWERQWVTASAAPRHELAPVEPAFFKGARP